MTPGEAPTYVDGAIGARIRDEHKVGLELKPLCDIQKALDDAVYVIGLIVDW
jgi:hypothetical protein